MPEVLVGIYQGEYTVLPDDRGIDLPLVIRVETKSGYIQLDTSQTVTLSGGIISVEVSGSPAKVDDVIEVTCVASPNGQAEFSIQRIVQAISMMEVQDGVYRGSYAIKRGDNADKATLTLLWTDSDGRTAFDESQTVRIDTILILNL